jgi:2-oxoglutarate ferredoxin oxidoreductase subunit gamma
MRKEIRISGFGGQGVALAGLILGKAISVYEGMEAVLTQSYGPEARGGASSADVVVADRPIAYPIVQHPDVLVALSQEAYARFRPVARQDALVLIDDGLVVPSAEDSVRAIPATAIAEELGRRIVANMVMLGFLCQVAGIAKPAALEKAIQSTVRQQTVELNLQAFGRGLRYGVEEKQRP